MNFEEWVDHLEPHPLLIFYIITALIGTFIIYHFGLKDDWQKLRIENGLCTTGNMLSPNFLSRAITNKKIFGSICAQLVLLSFVTAVIINILHYLMNEEVNISTPKSCLMSGMSLILLHCIFAGVPLETEQIDSSLYQPVMNALSKMKKQILNSAILREQDYYYHYLKTTFNVWMQSRDDNRLVTFVAAINEQFFYQVFSHALTEEDRARINLFVQDIGESYINSNILLNEQLNSVFVNELTKAGAELSLIVQLIANHNARKFTEEEINHAKAYLKSYAEKVNNEDIATEMVNIDDIVFDQFPSEISGQAIKNSSAT